MDKLVSEYIKTKDDELLSLIMNEAQKIAYKFISGHSLDVLQKDEFMCQALSTLLIDSINKYDKKRKSKFSTYYYWKLRCLLYDILAYHHRKRRIQKDKLCYIDDSLKTILNIRYDIRDEIILNDLVNTLKSFLSKNEKKVFDLLYSGYPRNKTFKKLRIKSSVGNKILSEIQVKLRTILDENKHIL